MAPAPAGPVGGSIKSDPGGTPMRVQEGPAEQATQAVSCMCSQISHFPQSPIESPKRRGFEAASPAEADRTVSPSRFNHGLQKRTFQGSSLAQFPPSSTLGHPASAQSHG